MPQGYNAYLRRHFEHKRGTLLTILGELKASELDLLNAVDAFHTALSLEDECEDASEWAMTQNNLGNTHRILFEMRGREQDLLDSVNAFHQALRHHDEFNEPGLWASTQCNLGNALTNLGALRAQDEILAEAINAYNAALRVYSKSRFPENWATVQNNLGVALLRRSELSGREQDVASSHIAINAALSARRKNSNPASYARSLNNIGAVFTRLSEMRESELDGLNAVKSQVEALSIFDPSLSIAYWASTLENLSWSLKLIGFEDAEAKEIRYQAIALALSSVTLFAAGAEPRHYLRILETSLRLGAVLSDLGDDVAAQAAAQMRLALRQAGDRDGRRHVLQEVAGLGDRLTCAALRGAANPDQLPVLLDLTRAREMGRRVELTERGMTEVERENLADLRARMQDLKRVREAAQARQAKADADACTLELKQIDGAIEALFTTVEDRLHLDTDGTGSMTLAAVQANLAAAGMSALVSVVSDDKGGLVLAIPTEGVLRWKPLDTQIGSDFDDILDKWLKAYVASFVQREPHLEGTPPSLTREAADGWEAHLQATLPALWSIAGGSIAALLAEMGLDADSRVALLLPGRLSILPWEAALGPDGQCLRDQALLSRIPSLQSLAVLAARKTLPDPETPSVVTVTDPRRDLPHEISAAGNPADVVFGSKHVTALAGEVATLDAVRAHFNTATLLSFFLHGSWGGRDASGSALGLAGNDLLTAIDIGEGDLPRCSTVVIGACASGNTALEAADEFDGLPAAFFSAGASSVIATLWPVYVVPTHQTLTRLFGAMAAGAAPNEALRTTLASIRGAQPHSLATAGLDNANPDPTKRPAKMAHSTQSQYPLSTSAAFFTFGK